MHQAATAAAGALGVPHTARRGCGRAHGGGKAWASGEGAAPGSVPPPAPLSLTRHVGACAHVPDSSLFACVSDTLCVCRCQSPGTGDTAGCVCCARLPCWRRGARGEPGEVRVHARAGAERLWEGTRVYRAVVATGAADSRGCALTQTQRCDHGTGESHIPGLHDDALGAAVQGEPFHCVSR